MIKKTLEFEPVMGISPGSYTALSIYPPGTWFGKRQFQVFVGGCGYGKRRTLASAKKFLLELAIGKCDERIAAAKAKVEHYERERRKLVDCGLRAEKTPANKR